MSTSEDMATISYRVTAEDYRAIRAKALAARESLSTYCRKAVMNRVNYEPIFDTNVRVKILHASECSETAKPE